MDQDIGSTPANAPMHEATIDVLMHLIEEVVAVHIRLQVLAEELHGHSEVSRACRGILRDLHRMGPRTVPQLARGRPVSRPNVLMLVNRLVAQGLAEALPNPDHKRSYLVRLTGQGATLLEDMERRERDILRHTSFDLPLADLETATGVLQRVRQGLEQEQRAAFTS
jgi:DNA-binding MarR family transcriptional regulator